MVRRSKIASLAAVLGGAVGLVLTWGGIVPAQTTSTSSASAYTGLPMVRSIEHSLQRASQDPGPFRSIGFASFVHGLSTDDLFDIPPGDTNAPVNESNARISHTESGMLLRVVPNRFVPPRPGENNAYQTTINRATHNIYYNPHPSRDWTRPETFTTGELVAVWELTEETDFIDLNSRVGTGTARAELTFSKPFTLPSGQTFDFASLGHRLVADFQFQVATGLTSPDPGFPLVVVDGGVWKFQS